MAVAGQVQAPERLRTERVSVDSGSDQVPAYLARPVESGTYPGIIVIHEAFGPVEHIDDIARRFANVGFLALAPSLYHRVGVPDPNTIDAVLAAMFGVKDAEVVADLDAAARFLRADSECSGKVGVIGFCSGGRQALLFACSSDPPDAAVDCWGGFLQSADFEGAQTTEARPTRPIDLLENLGCPLYAVFGAEDDNPSPEDAAELERRLGAAGKDATVEIFADAGHAFLADYRDMHYREGPAHKLWPKIIEFFEQHLR
jgi:carboxymethylenebutenolidase